MDRSWLAVAALMVATPGLVGCIAADGGALDAASRDALDVPSIVSAVTAAQGTDPAGWIGQTLKAEGQGTAWTPACIVTGCGASDAPCTEASCERIPFTLDLPADYWAVHDGGLEVSILWSDPDREWPWLTVALYDAAGTLVGRGMGGIGQTLILDEAPPGSYEAVVQARYGEAAYEGVIQLEAWPADGPVRDLLPDLVVLPPTDLQIPDAPGWLGWLGLPGALAAKGCTEYEATEGQAKRCLRFSNRVGNLGEGPLEVHLTGVEGAKAAAGAGVHTQRIFASDGSYRDEVAGPASFHPTHTHFHYEGLNQFAVYEYDEATGTRGALVNTGHKGGVCLVDSGLIALGLPHTRMPNYDITCFYPAFTALGLLWGAEGVDWYMSLTPNWYDLYGWGLDDMYVDMDGAPDGVYALVSSTNTDGSLIESDTTNNEASVVFRLTGDEVEVLDQ